jgi:hypothetical protein
VQDFLSFQTPHSKLLGSTAGIITTAVVASILLVLLLAPVFWAAARPDVRRPGEPRPARPLHAGRRSHKAIGGNDGQGYSPAEHPRDRHIREGGSHLGKPASWIVVAVVTIAFLIGGIALITHTMWLFWTCVGLVVLSGPAGKAVGIMDDTVEWGSSEASLTRDPGPGQQNGPDERPRDGGPPVRVPGETEHRP